MALVHFLSRKAILSSSSFHKARYLGLIWMNPHGHWWDSFLAERRRTSENSGKMSFHCSNMLVSSFVDAGWSLILLHGSNFCVVSRIMIQCHDIVLSFAGECLLVEDVDKASFVLCVFRVCSLGEDLQLFSYQAASSLCSPPLFTSSSVPISPSILVPSKLLPLHYPTPEHLHFTHSCISNSWRHDIATAGSRRWSAI